MMTRCNNLSIKIFRLRMFLILFVICCSLFWRAAALPVNELTLQLMDKSNENCADCFWVKPCLLPPIKTDSTITNEAYNIKAAITFSLNHVHSYADSFCNVAFEENFATAVNRDANNSYNWIYNGVAPKNIGERLDFIHYQSIEILLSYAADTFRRAAVGFEFIASEVQHPFFSSFNATKNWLQNLLCVIEAASTNLNMQLPEHPTREIMGSELRDPQLDEFQKNERNFRILKADVNLLEYFEDGFSYFSQSFKL